LEAEIAELQRKCTLELEEQAAKIAADDAALASLPDPLPSSRQVTHGQASARGQAEIKAKRASVTRLRGELAEAIRTASTRESWQEEVFCCSAEMKQLRRATGEHEQQAQLAKQHASETDQKRKELMRQCSGKATAELVAELHHMKRELIAMRKDAKKSAGQLERAQTITAGLKKSLARESEVADQNQKDNRTEMAEVQRARMQLQSLRRTLQVEASDLGRRIGSAESNEGSAKAEIAEERERRSEEAQKAKAALASKRRMMSEVEEARQQLQQAESEMSLRERYEAARSCSAYAPTRVSRFPPAYGLPARRAEAEGEPRESTEGSSAAVGGGFGGSGAGAGAASRWPPPPLAPGWDDEEALLAAVATPTAAAKGKPSGEASARLREVLARAQARSEQLRRLGEVAEEVRAKARMMEILLSEDAAAAAASPSRHRASMSPQRRG